MVKQYRPTLKRDDPFVAISSDSSLVFKTGSQRSERPLFINKIAPCRNRCPIGIDIPTAFHLASKGDIDGALCTFLQDNPLPGVCGRVCYHPCEAECNRGNFDEAINIRSFERFLSGHGQMDIKAELDASEDDVVIGLDFLADPWRWSLEDDMKKTLVIGGGNVAIDVARTLVRIRKGKVSNITVVCPESRDQMLALPEEVKEALEEGIAIINGWAPHKLYKESGKPSFLDFHRARVRIDEESGTFEIIALEKEIQRHTVDKIIVAIGESIRHDSLPAGTEVKEGRIVTDRFGRTSLPKVFAGGDSISKNAFVADAIASGKKGAFAISCLLEGRDIEEEFQTQQIGNSQIFSFQHYIESPEKDTLDLKTVVTFDHINTLFFSEWARNNPEKLEPENRKETFDEVVCGLEPLGMEEEISRCFTCGTCIDCEICVDFCPDISILKDRQLGIYSYKSDYCKGCGVCSVACPRGVVEMVRETQ